MKDKYKTKEQLIRELEEARRQIAEQDSSKMDRPKYWFSTLANNLAIGIYIVQEGKFRFVNSMFRNYVGYSEKELLDMDSLSLVFPEDRDMVREKAVQMLKGERSDAYEFRYINKAGDKLWVMESVISIWYRGARATLGNFMDITRRKLAEEMLRESKQLYQKVFNSQMDALFILDRAVPPNIIECNPEASNIFGYRREEMLGRDTSLLHVSKGEIRRFQDIIQPSITEQGFAYIPEFHMRRKDGTVFSSEHSVVELKNDYNQRTGWVSIVRDITGRKQAERKARQAAEEWSSTFDSIPDLVSIHDRNCHIVRVNSAMASALNAKPEELTGRKCYEVFHGTNEPPPDCPHIKTLNTKLSAWDDFFEPQLGIYLEVSASPILNEFDEVTGSVHIARDVSERKKAEVKLQELYEQELRLREGLEAERKKSVEFTRVLVHELKTPLTPMLAASQLLIEELKDKTLLRLARNINQGALNLSSRVDEFLDLVRGDIGILKLEPKSIDIRSLLRNVIDEITPMASNQGHSVILDIATVPQDIRADENRLRQVLLNLLNNASKFTPKGGVITLRAREENSSIIVEVQDTGRGISKKDQERLFDPYYRVESDRQRFSGMGLGLALAKTLVELHGGEIWVKSRQKEGSTFGFSIPVEGSA